MELPKHSCISCAYLCEAGTGVIRNDYREGALDSAKWNRGHINYMTIICHMGKQHFPEFMKNNQVIEIRNEVIKPNNCKYWVEFTGIPPVFVEQRKSSRWAKWAFWVAITTLAIVLITWILSQFVLNKS